MITKKLLHDIITFCNNYIDNNNIVFDITKYPKFVNIAIGVWTTNSVGIIDKSIGTISSYIVDIDDFNKFKQKALNQLPLLLKQVKENNYVK